MKYIFLSFCAFFLACVPDKQKKDINSIVGVVKNIPSNRIYLTDGFKWDKFLDSADYKNDSFLFRLNTQKNEPFLASLCFINSVGKIQQLAFKNYILSTENKQVGYTSFMVEDGITKISGDLGSNSTNFANLINISPGKQNDPFFKTQEVNFGFINVNENELRSKLLLRHKALIEEFPNSYYFIRMLHEYRRLFSKEELSKMILLFSKEIKESTTYKEILTYLNELPSLNQPLTNFVLKDSLKNNVYVLDTSAKLNMILLWASWCGPCRKEIPLLKEIYSEFNNRGLSMVSISLDTKSELWERALYLEKMKWKQLIVDSSLIDKLKDNFRSWAIPTTIFTDDKGREIVRFTGYDTEKSNEYLSIIKQYCK